MKLQEANQQLYLTFGKYSPKAPMDACSCGCISEDDKSKLLSKDLKELTTDDISKYAFKAMSTWGNVEDFKHFLPRIFELMSTTGIGTDTFVILKKLEDGDWNQWPTIEQNAIREFLIAWWNNLTNRKHADLNTELVPIHGALGTMDPLLEHWIINIQDESFRNYVEFMFDNFNALKEWHAFRDLGQSSQQKLFAFLIENAKKLEAGFFYYELKDQEFAKRISDIQYTVEHA